MHADGRSDDRPPDPPSGESVSAPSADPHRHRHHPYLIEADEDRWRWRARIRRDPRQLFFYRIGVGLLGLFLMIAAAITGPLPGPGGIPLFLLGLAVWSSEFEWAQNLMLWFKTQFRRYRGLGRGWRFAVGGLAVVCAITAIYLAMVVHGIPPWLPPAVRHRLAIMPGLN